MWVCGFIFAIVTGGIIYALVRFRHRPGTRHTPAQVSGNTRLEVAWTAGPIALVTLLFVFSVAAARSVDQPVNRDPDVVVTGHQWWWQVNYPAAGVITANEVHIPVAADVLIEVDSADVIHDFWAPRLGRKIDAIPGKRNFIWIRANQAGVYSGACAEFCGAQHAWMRFRVVAEDAGAYRNWIGMQAQPARTAATAEEALGQTRFRELTCANCHNIRGVNSQQPFAPDLTHLAGRAMLAAERLPNTLENLKSWLHEPNLIKPDCLMPNLNLSASDLNALTAYLGSLQ